MDDIRCEDSGESLGPFCNGIGLTSTNFIEKLRDVLPANFTNGHVFELFLHIQKSKFLWKTITDCLRNLYPDMSSNEQTVRKSFLNVKEKRRSFLKGRDRNRLQTFLSDLYVPPKPKPKSQNDSSVVVVRPALVDEVAGIPPRKKARTVQFEDNVKDDVIEKLAKENGDLVKQIHELQLGKERTESAVSKTREENLRLKVKLGTLTPHRIRQTIRRHKKSVLLWKQKYVSLLNLKDSRNVKKMRLKLTKARERIVQLRNQRKISSQARKHRRAKKKMKTQFAEMIIDCEKRHVKELCEKDKEIRILKEEVKELETECEILREQLQDIKDGKSLDSKRDGKTYHHGVREASFALQNFGVSQRNVAAALKSVHKALTDDEIGQLPSYTSQNNFIKEMKALSRQQVKEALSNQDQSTLKYDGTTKTLGHMVETELATKDETLLVGLTLQTGGTSAEYAKTITKACERLDNTQIYYHSECGDNQSVLKNVKNTMTDRCATNAAIDDKLEQSLGLGIKFNRFKCAMHPLDSIAKDCEKSIVKFEGDKDVASKKSGGNYPFIHRGESNTQALVRVASKLFHDTKFNCCIELSSYLRSKGAVPHEDKDKSVLYYRFVGNRFHVYFLSSACLYHYRPAILEFFTEVFPPNNAVHTSVFNALRIEDLHTTTRALGIISKVLTGPWMRLISQTDNILDMNEHFKAAHENLSLWAEDSSTLISDSVVSAFPAVDIKKDEVLESLLAPSFDDEATVSLLEELCKACIAVMDRQLQSQLPGGEFWNPSSELIEEAKSCSNTNISGERNFAMADHELKRARAAKTGFVEAKVMFRVNRTGQWLAEMPENEKSARSRLARLESRKISEQDTKDVQEHNTAVKEKLISTRKKLLEKEDKERNKVEKWLEDAFDSGGLWTERAVMENHLKGLSKSKTISALKTQINIRMKVFNCSPKEKVTLGKCSVDDLTEILGELMEIPVPPELEDLYELILVPKTLTGMAFSQRWLDEGITKWYTGEVVSCDVTSAGRLDFKVVYDDDSTAYMATEEIMVDILRGDLELFIR